MPTANFVACIFNESHYKPIAHAKLSRDWNPTSIKTRRIQKASPALAPPIASFLFIFRREKFRRKRRHAGWREAFDACDADKSGKISCSELVKVLQAIGYAEKAEQVAAVSTN